MIRRQLTRHRLFVGLLIGTIGLVGGLALLIKLGIPMFSELRQQFKTKLQQVAIIKNPTQALASSNGQTNILILGRGGGQHEGPDLTDTMMIMSLRLSDRRIRLISIPRDIWIDSLKAKINSAYFYGEKKQPGSGGFVMTRDAVFQVTDLPIQYTLLVDFTGFKKAIDLVGGVDVEVDRSFTDEKYPIESDNGEKPQPTNGQPLPDQALYETIHFEKGSQHMDGTTALKFVRSRNSTDPEEGTDFARGQRQQKVLVALASKLRQKETVLNVGRIQELRNIFSQYVVGDLGDDALLALGRIGLDVNPSAIEHIGLEGQNAGGLQFLVNPPVKKYGQWVLEPRIGNWDEIHQYIQQELER